MLNSPQIDGATVKVYEVRALELKESRKPARAAVSSHVRSVTLLRSSEGRAQSSGEAQKRGAHRDQPS